MKVSLITTERNEYEAIAAFIESALSQSHKPDEIIIADGGSTDGTIEVINEYINRGAPIKLVHAPGNRSVGRNAATAAASHEIIAVTDVGGRLDHDWLKNITEPFRRNPQAMAVAGGFRAEPQTYFEDVSTALMLAPNEKIDLATWLPSSRSVAYKKEAWAAVGGYPEHTNFNEDTPFDLALKNAGYKFEDGLNAIAYWRPRSNLREFYRQYYFYAVGDGIDRLHFTHFVKLTLKYCLTALLSLALLFAPGWWKLLALVPIIILKLTIARRVYRPWRKFGDLLSLVLMGWLAVVYDLSQILGYWRGVTGKKKLSGSTKLIR